MICEIIYYYYYYVCILLYIYPQLTILTLTKIHSSHFIIYFIFLSFFNYESIDKSLY